ncbi:rust resistance kinase Lr10-like [Neltuma alba]|uniref:rust resistance kinase Lr10-like n=1 Tax=Neltuma alba TaxID=207710 RepID=UPI0010A43D56|nr:rust resistance kinase Lr10-like [Prosopis alba]
MEREKGLRWWDSVLLALLLTYGLASSQEQSKSCAPSQCGIITNIRHPFRLRDDPPGCGDPIYELACENNITLLHLNSATYRVLGIDHSNFTIRLVDPGIQEGNCSSLPHYLLSLSNFTDSHSRNPYDAILTYKQFTFKHVVYLKCRDPVRDDVAYLDTAPCVKWEGKSHVYAVAGDLSAYQLKSQCRVKSVATIASDWESIGDQRKKSYTDIHIALSSGFELSWWRRACIDFKCPSDRKCSLDPKTTSLVPYMILRFSMGVLLLSILLIYKYRRRHMSMFENIEDFIRLQNLIPIRYSYKELRAMTEGFKIKLGEGGFGTVYKGKLRSGSYVAIKMLGKSKANCQEFISEVATIGRIHHFNVVHLVGFCVEGTKRALVYEYMSNGSLDKYIFPKKESVSLSFHRIYEISLGVARGIPYLHHGCDMQILHFDIKPHNILLDDNFSPKISDFGLARLYSVGDSIVTLTAARGTIGYMAPELFYKNIGGVSHKADVYSFGMLLMEMASRRRNLNSHVEHSSQLYFPLWIYDHFDDDKDIGMEDLTEEEKDLAKKMFIVALWCIQLKPADRPSMNKVIEMLEANDVRSLEMPSKPSLYPNETVFVDHMSSSSQTTSTIHGHSHSNLAR